MRKMSQFFASATHRNGFVSSGFLSPDGTLALVVACANDLNRIVDDNTRKILTHLNQY